MKAIIDTNVLVSAIIRDGLPEKVVLFLAHDPQWQWMASEEILQEYCEVLARPKFKLPEPLLARWHALFKTKIIPVLEVWPVTFERDPKDAKFLACALACDADYLISGDSDFGAASLGSTRILSARQFADLFLGKQG
jgi:putative PIN family toxin of toxin-antitoxin system